MISSIGVALALVRDVVERIIPNAQPEDIKRIRREAFEAVVKLGADPEGVEVTIEVDPNTHRVRATAMGASEMRARQRRDEVGESEAREIAAKAMGVSPERVALAAATPRMRVFQGEVEERSWGFFKKRRSPVRAVDLDGVIRVQRSHSVVRPVPARTGARRAAAAVGRHHDLQWRQHHHARHLRDRRRPADRSLRRQLDRSGHGRHPRRARWAHRGCLDCADRHSAVARP